jgi:hypothetical protein
LIVSRSARKHKQNLTVRSFFRHNVKEGGNAAFLYVRGSAAAVVAAAAAAIAVPVPQDKNNDQNNDPPPAVAEGADTGRIIARHNETS